MHFTLFSHIRSTVRPAARKLCTIAIPESHSLWIDSGVPKSWKRRLASVLYDPPAGIVVDPSKDVSGRVLSEKAFADASLATQIAVSGMTVQLPAPADLSGIQPWIDHLQLAKTLPAIPIVRFDAAARTVTLASAPVVPSATSWIIGRPAREYDVFIDDAPDVGQGNPFEPSLTEPSVYAQIAVSAADDKPHVADTYPGESRSGNESRLSPSATIYRVLQKPPDAPELPALPDRLIATPADYHDRSYTTFRFIPKDQLRVHILRALDESLFERDWLIRETRMKLDPVLDPKAEDAKVEHLAFFPDGWTYQRRKDATDEINALATGASYDNLSNEARLVLALLPGNEAQPDYNALKQRDALMRRIRGPVPSTDPDVFPHAVADRAAYDTLPDNALRRLAALPGNEAAFAQITLQPLEMSDPVIQDQRRPDDVATYTPTSTVRAYMDTLPGRATNRYFYRAMFVDGAQNQSALSPPGPPVYLPKVEPPRAPVITKVIGGDRQITIQWAKNRDEDLSHYQIYRTDREEAKNDLRLMTFIRAPDPSSVTEPQPGELQWIDSPVPALTTLYYRLTAVDAHGNVSKPSAVTVGRAFDDSHPDPPVWVPPAPGTNPEEIALSWSSPISDLRCLVQRQIAGAAVWDNASKWLAPGAYAFTDGDRIPGLQYVYRLRVMDNKGKTNREYRELTV